MQLHAPQLIPPGRTPLPLARTPPPCRGCLEQKLQSQVDSDHVLQSVATVPQVLRRTALSMADLHPQRLIASSSGANFVSTVCNIADSLIGAFLGPQSLKPSNDPAVQLSGNYAPVPECPPQRCVDISGSLPLDLNGIYIRNGPNATRLFEHEGYHMFDGDGMLHGVHMQAGKAIYCSRYVRTSRFVQEEIAGRPLFLKFFGGFYGFIGFARAGLVLVRAVLGVLNMSEGWGLSNTSVCYFNGRVLSLSEDDMPYVVRVTNEGDFITLGRLQFSHTMPSRNMCAHPKFDASTGEMFAFSFRPSLKYPFSFYKVSPDGIKSREVTIPLKEIPFIHDFAITQNYAIFPDSQFVIRPWNFFHGEMPVVCDKKKTPRFCVMPRDATTTQSGKSRPLWFKAPDCNAYHYINAWEEGDEVVLITPIISPPERFLDIPARAINCHLTEVRLNLEDGSTSMKRLSNENLEFGTFNLDYTGRKMRYVYLAVGCYPEISGIVKVDLEAQGEGENSCIVARRDFGKGFHGNEPFFVPRTELPYGDMSGISHVHSYRKSSNGGGRGMEEDDGYVLCLVHDQRRGASCLLVMDAQSPSLDILASIKLPSRVPYGFHGFFISESQLAKQAA
ncbi:hypothetical protein GOP47_0026836 [Adiantum capillus-veneris]|nr:hypothetical protein GOP47_0026836 [Adiantum capillus-veneris]